MREGLGRSVAVQTKSLLQWPGCGEWQEQVVEIQMKKWNGPEFPRP